MRAYKLDRLSDGELLRALAKLAAQERTTTVELVAHIAEVDVRRLFVPAGYSSMHEYCVQELRLSDDAASKRIQVARKAREFPALWAALADGRLHLTGARLLAPPLTAENAEGLITAATLKRKAEIEQLVAERFPLRDLPTLVRAIPATAALRGGEHAPGHAGAVLDHTVQSALNAPPGAILTSDPEKGLPAGQTPAPSQPVSARTPQAPFPKVTPLAPERYALQVTIAKSTHEKLRRAQELLSHSVPSGDIDQVLDRALDALIKQLEKSKFAATDRPRKTQPRPTTNPRHIPVHVKRAVIERDRAQCTFVGDAGHRCGARKFLQFDHIDPVARGGTATVENIRLRCRAHNQLEAERTYGDGFMHQKRERVRAMYAHAAHMNAARSARAAAP